MAPKKLRKFLWKTSTQPLDYLSMPRPSQLSSDNLLRFLQVRRDPASTEDIAAGLHMRRADRHALYKMLGKLKKRGLIEEVPGGRYRLAGRNEEQRGDGQGGGERSRSAAPTQRSHARRSGTTMAPDGWSRDRVMTSPPVGAHFALSDGR